MAQLDEKDQAPFAFSDPDNYARMRDILETAGFMDRSVLETIGISDLPSIDGNDHPLLLERTATGAPLHTLIRLFLMDAPVDPGLLQKTISPMPLEAWHRAGLIRGSGAGITATIKLLPFQGLVLGFDRPDLLKTPQRSHYVMGIGGSTITLSRLTIRQSARQVLDLGTGCGVHALLAAAHSGQVTATDINPRAVRLARFNARLNAVANLECLEGRFFEPVPDRCFDLVITNPPFVISPETRFIYRDGGMAIDDVCRHIVRQVPRFLNEGGFCQILGNWAQEADRDWKKRLSGWFADTGCDAWVMRSESLSTAEYASKWIRHTEFHDHATPFAERFRQWMAYYDEHGIESIGMGLITLRKTGGRTNWFRADQSPEKMTGPCGSDVARGFAGMDFLQTVSEDEKLLDARLRCNPAIRLEQQYEPSPQGWKTTASMIYLAEGLAYRGKSDPLIANLIAHCDGLMTLKELLPGMAQPLGTEPEKIAPTVCRLIRKLVQQGFLLPEPTRGMP